jgi:hypothetical protein
MAMLDVPVERLVVPQQALALGDFLVRVFLVQAEQQLGLVVES